MPQYRVLVSGTLSFDDYPLLRGTLDRVLAGKANVVIVTGGATGAEALAERYAAEHALSVKQYLVDWERYGRGAKVIRNTQLIEVANLAVFFWDGKNKGVGEMIEKVQEKGFQSRWCASAPLRSSPNLPRAARVIPCTCTVRARYGVESVDKTGPLW